jgi:hypothetical protein
MRGIIGSKVDMAAIQKPSRDAFIAYWADYDVFRWRQLLWYLGYLGVLALFVFVVRRVDAAGRFMAASFVIAVTYVILIPYLTVRRVRTKFARFIRCPQCGDYFAQDTSGAFHGPNPKFRGIIETGRCGKCGTQIISDI